MNWTDIEAKWAAMARRVRSDQLQDSDDTVITRAAEPIVKRNDAAETRAQPPIDRPVA